MELSLGELGDVGAQASLIALAIGGPSVPARGVGAGQVDAVGRAIDLDQPFRSAAL
jgi:hypothetical protein